MQHSQGCENSIAVLNELGSGRSHLGRIGRGVRLLLALLLVLPQTAFAATIVVDESTCTLSSAITAANSDVPSGGCPTGAGADTLQLAADVSLTSPLPSLSSDITLEGGGFTVERTGGPSFPVFLMTSGTVTLNEVTVRGGVGFYGGAVTMYGGSLAITNSTLSGNSGNYGGAVGGYYLGGISITNSTLSGNTSNYGGAVYPGLSTLLTITNSTLTGNSAAGFAGGIYAGNALISNTIIAGNSGGNCNFPPGNGGNNFADDGSCGAFAGITPGLDFDTILADNGGPTETHALLAGSVAIDAAGVCGLPADQRGFLRDDGACDSGAYEFNGTPPGGECQPGTVGPGGVEPCTPCPVGTSQPSAGAEACLPCAPGTFAGAPGSVQCAACPADTFQPDPGAGECLPCPAGTTTGGQIGQTECAPEVPMSSPWSLLVLGLGLLAVLPVVVMALRRREHEA